MWSRTWCFNRTLFRKNLTRFWPLWAMASFLAALPPIMMAVELVRRRGDLAMTPLDITDGYYSALSGMVPAVLLVYAVVCAMAVWSYLFSARSVGLMHTLPVSRKGLFLTNFLSGFVMVLLPLCGVWGAVRGDHRLLRPSGPGGPGGDGAQFAGPGAVLFLRRHGVRLPDRQRLCPCRPSISCFTSWPSPWRACSPPWPTCACSAFPGFMRGWRNGSLPRCGSRTTCRWTAPGKR